MERIAPWPSVISKAGVRSVDIERNIVMRSAVGAALTTCLIRSRQIAAW